jgi:hypothetical protein
MIHKKDLAKFGYKLNTKVEFPNTLQYFLLHTWIMYRNLAKFLYFFRILAFENLKKNLILAGAIFNIAFWLYIYIVSKKEGCKSEKNWSDNHMQKVAMNPQLTLLGPVAKFMFLTNNT